MEQLPRLQARISSLKSFHNIVRALRAMAATRVQQAQSALPGTRQYVKTIEDAIAQVAAFPSFEAELAQLASNAEQHRAVMIVVCSEHGFVGGFNERLLDYALSALETDQVIAVIGLRGRMLAEERGLAPQFEFPMATHVGGVLGLCRIISERLMVSEASKVDVVYGAYQKGAGFRPHLKHILPFDPATLARRKKPTEPLHHLSAEVLLQQLANEYLLAEFTGAVMESLASENGARLRVMEAADHNVADKLEQLARDERTLRQEAITSELSDLISGARVVLEG